MKNPVTGVVIYPTLSRTVSSTEAYHAMKHLVEYHDDSKLRALIEELEEKNPDPSRHATQLRLPFGLQGV